MMLFSMLVCFIVTRSFLQPFFGLLIYSVSIPQCIYFFNFDITHYILF